MQLDQAIPDAGTTITQFANSSANLTFFCLITRNESQLITNWLFLTAANRDMGLNPTSVLSSNPKFVLSGAMIGTFPSSTNLTVVGLTPDLNNLTLSCGFDTTLAEFTIIVYGEILTSIIFVLYFTLTKSYMCFPDNPSIPVNLTVTLNDLIATISWEPPTNLGSPNVAYYSLVISDDGGNVLSNVTLPASGLTEFNATGLLPLTNYSIELRAVSQVNPVLVISPAAELNFTTNTSGINLHHNISLINIVLFM